MTAIPPVQVIFELEASVSCRKPRASSSWARFSEPASIAFTPPAMMRSTTVFLEASSSPATSTVVSALPSFLVDSVAARLVLNAFSTVDAGSSAASWAAAELPSGTTSESKVSKFTGLVMSMTILPSSWLA